MGEWKPIESAPKDGTHILLWGSAAIDDATEYAVAMWDSLHRIWIDPCDAEVCHEDPDAYQLLGFRHWQPLPPPPHTERAG